MRFIAHLPLTVLSLALVVSCSSSPDAASTDEELTRATARCEEAFVQLKIEHQLLSVSEGIVPEGYPPATDATVCNYQDAEGSIHSLLLRPGESPVLLPDDPAVNLPPASG